MDRLIKIQPSRWWLENNGATKRSAWLQSTIDDLNEKTNTMLKLIEEDADSFAKRAEMYYKKRPELISMVEEFYRTHRSLAERYDQVKPDNVFHPQVLSPKKNINNAVHSPTLASTKKWFSFGDNHHVYDSYSEKSVESEVDNPDKDEEEEEEKEKYTRSSPKEKDHGLVNVKANGDVIKVKRVLFERHNDEENKGHNNNNKDEIIKHKGATYDEVMKLREEVERLRKDNEEQKEQLKQKDEEKIQVIRHMSVAIDMLKQENVGMRNCIIKLFKKTWKSPFEMNKFMRALSRKLFNGGNEIAVNETSVVAL